MQQPLIRPGDNRAAYSYTLQPTEDHDEQEHRDGNNTRGRKSPVWRSDSTPNYKPTALRWPFIGTVIALLLVAIVLVIVAERQMPNSDSNVQILGVHPNATQPVRFARAVFDASTPEGTKKQLYGQRADEGLGPERYRNKFPTTNAPLCYWIAATKSSSTTSSSTSTTASLPSGARLIPISTSVSKFTTSITVPITTVTHTSVFTSVHTIIFTTDTTLETEWLSSVTIVGPTTFYSHFTTNGTQASMPVSTATHTYISLITVTDTETVGVVASTATSTGTVTATSTITGVVIPSVGEVTITYYRTVFPPEEVPVTQPPDPVKVTGVEVIEGSAVDVVQSQGPVVVVVSPSNKIVTQVVGPQVSTGVARVGGSVVTTVLVITPTAGVPAQVVTRVGGTPVTIVDNPDPVTVVTVIDGAQRTIVETPPPQTVVTVQGGVVTTIMGDQSITSTIIGNVGGTPNTQVFVTTPSGPPFQPVSYTVVREAGGTLFTEVVVTTPTAAGQPLTLTAVDIVGGTPVTQVVVTTVNGAVVRPVSFTITTNVGGTPTVITVTPSPTTIVETINGTPITRVTTPPVTSFTTTIGGTLTTQVVVTTPTGTEPITLTVVSTSGDSLSTFTTTIPPTTRLTTISGTVRTITSTPSPSTILSTLPPTTRTFTSTATATHTTSTPLPTIISSTRTYRWTEADIFLGTFLPPLLGVALVIPLRILDLNAKLYQPFQSLTHPPTTSHHFTTTTPPSPATHPLLQQHTGLLALTTPLTLLLHPPHHPIPLLTTLAVALASLAAPLAAEAVGLKLHGACWANTASAGCAPALGVSVAPAYVLVGVLVVVVGLVGVVGWVVVVGGWVTGVRASPWSLAGVASLAGGGGEYGIVLVDEAGEGFRRGEGGGVGEGEEGFYEDEVVGGKRGSRRQQQLPFMTLRYPWRIAFILFQLALLVFIIYYHAYYRGGVRDNGRLWLFLNSNHFGVRFVSAIIGVIIAFCWQSFFLSVSTMTPFHLLSQRTQPPGPSILFTPPTNPFSGLYSAIRHRQPFLFAVSLAAALSEFLPVVLSNVPFNLAQTGTAATVCAVLSCVALGLLLAVLAASFAVRYPPMPVDPRSVAGLLWYVARSGMLADFAGVSRLDGEERARRVGEMGRRYFYGVLVGDEEGRRLGVDCDIGGGGEEEMGYRGAGGPTYIHSRG
ncbi:uncharacterized protein B0H64DRAFT_437732 [Chaetomium fimeti]|uniref:Zonadhesin n=1 Tax=Chaetomium fimeti TaxID=1854472 RepID=A0AAE0LWW7_9PEZI|nr:hypothetical protein B0H64DRAFT_437732 [Chaetomium fimeti]